MAYTFELTISGIIGVVRQNKGKRLRIVVPDTLMGKPASGKQKPTQLRKAVDEFNLLRHDPSYKVGSGPPTPLRSRRLVFEFHGRASSLSLPRNLLLPTMARALKELDQKDCYMDSTYADPSPGAPVSAILDIERGEVVPLTCGTAKLDTVGGEAGRPREMAHALRWIVADLGSPPKLQLQTLAGAPDGPPTELPADGNNKVEVELMSHRFHRGRDVDPKAVKDDDFRWFYDMLTTDAYGKVRNQLGTRDAPVPTQKDPCPQGKNLFPSTGGQLCRPCEFCGP